MKTAEDWAREIEADPSIRAIAIRGLGGVMAASELWALAQTLGREVKAAIHDDLGVTIYVNPAGGFTVYMYNPFQSGRGCLAPQTIEQYREGP